MAVNDDEGTKADVDMLPEFGVCVSRGLGRSKQADRNEV